MIEHKDLAILMTIFRSLRGLDDAVRNALAKLSVYFVLVEEGQMF